MAIIRLTEQAWYEREYARVKAVLTHRLTREGLDQTTLARELRRYLGTEYTAQELQAFKDNLVTDGVIEVA